MNYDNATLFLKQLFDSKPKRLYDILYIDGRIQLDAVAGGIEIKLEEK